MIGNELEPEGMVIDRETITSIYGTNKFILP